MIHNHVLSAAGRRDGSYWAAGFSAPAFLLPGVPTPGGVLAQVQGARARSCRIMLSAEETPLLLDALREAAREAEAGGKYDQGRSVSSSFGVSTWRVRVEGSRVLTGLENHHGDEDEVELGAQDARDFAAELRHQLDRLLSDQTRRETEALGKAVDELALRGEWPPR